MSALTVSIRSEGQRLDNTLPLARFEILKEFNRVPSATLVFADGSIPERNFALSESDPFKLGKTLEVLIRREGDTEQQEIRLFKGMVTHQTIEAGAHASWLQLELKDKAVKMCTVKRTALYKAQKDSKIIAILAENSGLEIGKIAETGVSHPEIVQYESSDWDFTLLRAEANGLLVNVSDGVFSMLRPAIADEASQRFEYGMSPIIGLELRADAERQLGTVKAGAWDIDNQAMTEPETADNFALKQGENTVQPGEISEKLGGTEQQTDSTTWRTADEMKAIADGRVIRSRLALFRGWLSVVGQENISVGDTIELMGLGGTFNGKTLVTGVRHQFAPESGWQTDLQIGLPEEPFARINPDVQALPAAGLLPAVGGLHIGVVEAFEQDPDNHYRARVRVPAWQLEQEVIWARHANPDAGNQRGFFFHPEPGDEVVLGFIDNDPREAIILGSLHSSAKPALVPSDELTENNYVKGILTRGGITLRFDDEKKELTLKTIDAQKIVLNGQDKTMTLEDGNGNKIILNDSGIEIKSGGDLKIEASGKVKIKGSEVDIQ